MQILRTILLTVVFFGGMILIHELGHYICARIFRVNILEFAIGMGPRILKHTSRKTGILYSLRLFPIGGFVSMEGEDSEAVSENSLVSKPAWQRLIIMSAGAFMNIVLGFVLMLCMVLTSPQGRLGTTVVAKFEENAPSYQYGLRQEDEILRVGNARVHTAVELNYEITRQGAEPVDLTVKRDGEKLVLHDVAFATETEEGMTFGMRDFWVHGIPMTFSGVVSQTWYQGWSCIKMVWQSLGDLITGKYGIESFSGPVGVSQAIGQAASDSAYTLLYLCSLISMNLGVFNLLPLPALDGGRIAFTLLEIIRGKPVKREVEGYIHAVGLLLLLALMAFITVKDVLGLFR